MLTEEEIANIREFWQHAPVRTIEDIIKIHKGDIEMYQSLIDHKLEFVEVLGAILEERAYNG